MLLSSLRRSLPLALVLLLSGCGHHPEPSDRLSLLWISLDTLRADHLGMYGYHRDTSPFLDEFAKDGLYFDWVIAPQNSTLPSHMTLFTGYHPVVHGIMHSARNPGIHLAEEVPTLPQLLAGEGYVTEAWTDGVQMDRFYGFDRGFDVYRDDASPLAEKLDAALRRLDELEDGERFAFFIHTYAVHHPYDPPAPYDEMFVTPGKRTDAEKDLDRYDGSIREVDDLLREFLGEIRRRGLLDTTVVAITGDHGEAFHEHGIPHTGHGGHNLHQNITRVPWIVRHPSPRLLGQGKVEALVGLLDFANTTLAAVGVEGTLGQGGVDVLRADPESYRSYVSYTGEAWSLYRGTHHLLRSERYTGAKRNALFSTTHDPYELRPLHDPDRFQELSLELSSLRRELEAEGSRRQLHRTGRVPDPVMDRLDALGYMEEEVEDDS